MSVRSLYEEGNLLAVLAPAEPDAVRTVLRAEEGGEDGRSTWKWVRFANGDLALAVFPQGATYEALEGKTGGI